jgi:hypothetical protein
VKRFSRSAWTGAATKDAWNTIPERVIGRVVKFSEDAQDRCVLSVVGSRDRQVAANIQSNAFDASCPIGNILTSFWSLLELAFAGRQGPRGQEFVFTAFFLRNSQ